MASLFMLHQPEINTFGMIAMVTWWNPQLVPFFKIIQANTTWLKGVAAAPTLFSEGLFWIHRNPLKCVNIKEFHNKLMELIFLHPQLPISYAAPDDSKGSVSSFEFVNGKFLSSGFCRRSKGNRSWGYWPFVAINKYRNCTINCRSQSGAALK